MAERTLLTPAGHTAEHQLGVARQTVLRSEPQTFHNPRPEPFDEHVTTRHEPQDHLHPARRLEIDRQRPLAPLEQIMPGAVAAPPRGQGDSIDPDHIGAEVGQEHSGVRSRPDPPQLDDAHIPEGAGHVGASDPGRAFRGGRGSLRPAGSSNSGDSTRS